MSQDSHQILVRLPSDLLDYIAEATAIRGGSADDVIIKALRGQHLAERACAGTVRDDLIEDGSGTAPPTVRITPDTVINGDPIEGFATLSKEDEQVILDAIVRQSAARAEAFKQARDGNYLDAAPPGSPAASAEPPDDDRDEPDWLRMTPEERRAEALCRLLMVSRQGPNEPPAFGLGTLAMLLGKDISHEGVFTPRERLAVATMASRYAEAARLMAQASADLEEADLE